MILLVYKYFINCYLTLISLYLPNCQRPLTNCHHFCLCKSFSNFLYAKVRKKKPLSFLQLVLFLAAQRAARAVSQFPGAYIADYQCHHFNSSLKCCHILGCAECCLILLDFLLILVLRTGCRMFVVECGALCCISHTVVNKFNLSFSD